MIVTKPSLILRAVRLLVRAGLLKRGYGWLFTRLPERIWGGASLNISTDVGDMIVPIRDPASTGLVLWGCIGHEKHESKLIRCLASSFHVAIDVGAHVGWYTRLMWSAMAAGGGVYAFEPNPRSFLYLQENTRNRKGIRIFQSAVTEKDRQATLYCADSSNLSSAVRKIGEPLAVSGTSLDSACRRLGIGSEVDFVKCDVEAGELAVLSGARMLRNSPRPPIWMIEVDPGFLSEAGLSVEDVNSEVFSSRHRVTLYRLDDNGFPEQIAHVARARNTPNVFVVPEPRMEQFLAGVHHYSSPAQKEAPFKRD